MHTSSNNCIPAAWRNIIRKQIFAIAVATTVAIPALASTDVEIDAAANGRMLISYNLKEVSTEEGRAELERQIRRAANLVCGPCAVREAGSLAMATANRSCFNAAVASALRTVESKVGSLAAVSSTK